MKQDLNDLIREIKIQQRDIKPEEVIFIFEKLLEEMTAGGFETEISIKLRFFFDISGKPFVQASIPSIIPPSRSVYIGDTFETPFIKEDKSPLLAQESFAAFPIKQESTPDASTNQVITLFNTLINFPVMCIEGLYDQIKYEYFKNEFLTTKDKVEKNEIRKKIRDRNENNLFRATYGKPDPDVGRPKKSPMQIETEKKDFLQRLYSAFAKWQQTQLLKRNANFQKIPKQSEISNYLAFRRANAVEKKLSEMLNFYNLKFKLLWGIYLESQSFDVFFKKLSSSD